MAAVERRRMESTRAARHSDGHSIASSLGAFVVFVVFVSKKALANLACLAVLNYAGSGTGSSTKPFQVAMYFTKPSPRPSARRWSGLTGVAMGVKPGSAARSFG